MIYKIFGVRDNKKSFGQAVMIEDNEVTAVRGFSYMINQPGSIQNFSPADFDLFCLGEYDSESGSITPVVPAQFIVNGVSVLSEK